MHGKSNIKPTVGCNANKRRRKGPGSIVNIQTTVQGLNSAKGRDFSVLHKVQTCCGATRRFFREVQQLGPEVDHTPHLQPRRGMSGAIPLLCTGTTLPLHTHIRTTARLYTLFKAHYGEGAWKAIRDRLRVGLIMLGKLGTGSKERILGNLSL